ncbi:MAG: aminopeptidase, partial [Chloroflexi bacterium]
MKEPNSTNFSQIIVVVLIITAAVFAGMASLARPAIVPSNAPAAEFSAERAMAHIRAIFREPHSVGMPGNAQARDYIIAQLEELGLSPEVQQTTALIPIRGNVHASIVQNVIVRIPGTNSRGAILLDA